MSETKNKILIVEDEQTLLNALAEKCSAEGFDVIKAIDGEDGLKQAQTEQPHMILLDIILPKMDGLVMLEKLKSSEVTSKIPVLLLTNLSDQESISRVVELGANGYLIKADISLDDVVSKVKSLLNF